MASSQKQIPKTGTRSTLDPELESWLKSEVPDLHLGGAGDFHDERRHHHSVFGFHSLPTVKQASIGSVEFTALRGPHGTIPIRVFYPKSGEDRRKASEAAALVYFHGGGYTVGTVDEFEQGLRILAEESSVVVFAVEYKLAPEWRFPVQLDEYDAVLDWLQSDGGRECGINTDRILGVGDSAGGNMTAAICLRRKQTGKKPIKAQILFYPEARIPFDTPAAEENNTGLYLECNGIFSFADHYLPRGTPPSHPYISPSMQPLSALRNVPPAVVFTCGFDPLRDVGVEYASKLQEAGGGNRVTWHHFPGLTHGYLQMTPWSQAAKKALDVSAKEVRDHAFA